MSCLDLSIVSAKVRVLRQSWPPSCYGPTLPKPGCASLWASGLMDFAIAAIPGGPYHDNGEARPEATDARPAAWVVLLLRQDRGNDVVSRLASFGHRAHAEAFLTDFLAQVHAQAWRPGSNDHAS